MVCWFDIPKGQSEDSVEYQSKIKEDYLTLYLYIILMSLKRISSMFELRSDDCDNS